MRLQTLHHIPSLIGAALENLSELPADDLYFPMRYLVKARVKARQHRPLLEAINSGVLGKGSVAGDEYAHNMAEARVDDAGVAQWVETCFCATPLEEERPYWEKFFELISVQDAHARRNCKHENGTEPWACCDCDCTAKLEARLRETGKPFLAQLRDASSGNSPGENC